MAGEAVGPPCPACVACPAPKVMCTALAASRRPQAPGMHAAADGTVCSTQSSASCQPRFDTTPAEQLNQPDTDHIPDPRAPGNQTVACSRRQRYRTFVAEIFTSPNSPPASAFLFRNDAGMRSTLFTLAAAALLRGVLAAELRSSVLGLTEALAGQDSAGAPAIYSVGVLLGGEPLSSLGAVPTYADCASACRLNGECTAFAFCGAEVRQGSACLHRALPPPARAAALHRVSRLQPGPAIACRLGARCRTTKHLVIRSVSC